jgi:hypothetical protein
VTEVERTKLAETVINLIPSLEDGNELYIKLNMGIRE